MKCLNPKCGKTCHAPKAMNWTRWQLCYKCAMRFKPQYYQDKKPHGVGGKYLKPASCIPMTTPLIKNT